MKAMPVNISRIRGLALGGGSKVKKMPMQTKPRVMARAIAKNN